MKEFKLIVAGSRTFDSYVLLEQEIHKLAEELEGEGYAISLVSGAARGADSLAIDFAEEHGIECRAFPAEWGLYGKRAGYLRNAQMAEYADGGLVFWNGHSKGTAHMVQLLKDREKPCRVIRYKE